MVRTWTEVLDFVSHVVIFGIYFTTFCFFISVLSAINIQQPLIPSIVSCLGEWLSFSGSNSKENLCLLQVNALQVKQGILMYMSK